MMHKYWIKKDYAFGGYQIARGTAINPEIVQSNIPTKTKALRALEIWLDREVIRDLAAVKREQDK